ncbi:MAG: efflux RND transporter periplasmic adaptor subunit [Lentisphaerales bacterium]|nr:MAG: efflux RND transporter periplasmic adaptor subunit [Lentisphaerales bacterium]
MKKSIAFASLLACVLFPVVGAADTIRITGLTAAVYDADLGCSTPGLVSRIAVKVGARVEKGDVLLEFEKTSEELEVQRRKLIWEDKTQLVAAKQSLETITKDTVATRNLYESSRSVRLDELDRKELELMLSEAQVKQAQMIEAREEIEYNMAVEQQKRRQVTAPAPGVVIEIHVETGEYAQQQQPLVRLVNTDKCHLTCNAVAELSYRFELGQKLTIECDSPDGPKKVEGEVIFISPMVDSASGLKEIRLEFENADGAISPGVRGVVTLE